MKVTFDSVEVNSDLVELTRSAPSTQKAVKKLIRVLKHEQLTYLEAKKALDYTNQTLLNEFFNQKKI